MSCEDEDSDCNDRLLNFFSSRLRDRYYDNVHYDLPMVFGSETEFGLTYGKLLNENKAHYFPLFDPERVFIPIIKKVVEKTRAFARDPRTPWLREGLNHLDRTRIDLITREAISDERPRFSARDFYLGEIGIFLEEGSRLYVDGSHLESSISECREPYEVVCREKAMERIITGVLSEVEDKVGREIVILKDNTDRHGNSYGCHTNYLLKKNFFDQLYIDNGWSNSWLSFLVSGIIFTGSGRVGYDGDSDPCDYQISQRADYFTDIWGRDTMFNRSLINFRDEPLANREKYGRFHVILDDSNMAEWPSYLKLGTKAIVLNMLQHQFIEGEKATRYQGLFIANPVEALKLISRDLTCQKKILLADGSEKSALEIQEGWLGFVEDFYLHSHFNAFHVPWTLDVIERWQAILQWIRDDDDKLNSILDWRIKLSLIEGIKAKHAEQGETLNWQSGRIKDLDAFYHKLGPTGLYNRALKAGQIERIVTGEHIKEAMTEPSEKTRAWLRGKFIKHFLPHLVDASWELLAFHIKVGDFETLMKLDLDPLHSTRSEVGELFVETDDYEKFCQKFLSMYLSHKELF